eukprot:TRINITY_DN5317_c1_g1_i1.p1 TRINITY_DN5317_c1_g1~~TRINITY_DN5317_c1_g1_i1.p1  ORF type:complete len:267 (-),score=56.84 TRINITY_DN5317_c1_g1_i1:225-935(-)
MAAVRDLDALLQSLHGHLDEEGAKVCKAAQALLEAAKPSTRHSKQLQKQQQQKPQRAKGRGSGGKRKRADADPAADAAGELAEALRQMGVAMEAKHGLCLELGGQKLRLAQLAYDAIDLHVQRADRELARMEAELKRDGQLQTAPAAGAQLAAAAAAAAGGGGGGGGGGSCGGSCCCGGGGYGGRGGRRGVCCGGEGWLVECCAAPRGWGRNRRALCLWRGEYLAWRIYSLLRLLL